MEHAACLLIHGVAGGRYQVKPLEEYLKGKGIYAESITVKGHEADRKSLTDSKYYEWLFDADKKYSALAKRFNKVVIIGFSMGGLIALELARRNAPAALVTVNCPVYCVDLKNIFTNIIGDFKRHDFKNLRRYFKADNIPAKTLGELGKLLEYTKMRLGEVNAPALILQCEDDDVVAPKSARYIHENINSRQKLLKHYGRGGHHIFTDSDENEIFDDIYKFILESTADKI